MNERLGVLRGLLEEGKLSTQDELRVKLEKQKFRVTQSTISRDLRRIGAVRAVDAAGNTVYRMPVEESAEDVVAPEIVRNIQGSDAMVVIHTVPGLASMVARHIDIRRSEEFLGTIAGDDTVFVALSSKSSAASGVRAMQELLKDLE